MSVLVSDSSVLIDLERCQLLRQVFALNVEFVVPDVLFNRELRNQGGEDYIQLGLQVETLTPEELANAQQFMRAQRALSVPDAFALALAHARHWTLLTGDGPLRALAQTEHVDCHGVLWLLDLMADERTATLGQLHDGLKRLSAHPRCRLPAGEIEARLIKFASRPTEN
jgi:hypothetical protein